MMHSNEVFDHSSRAAWLLPTEKLRAMAAKSDYAPVRILLVSACAVVASIALLFWDYSSEVKNHQEVMLARGKTVLDALTAGTRAQGRMGRYRPARLSAVYEELASTPDIVGLALLTQSGLTISTGGEIGDLPVIQPDDSIWDANRLIVSSEPRLLGYGPGRGMGQGAEQGRGPAWANDIEEWEPFPTGPYLLIAVLDTQAMQVEIQRDRVRYFIATLVMMTAIALASVYFFSIARRRTLQDALLVAQERAAQQEHLTQLGAGLAHETKNPLGIVRGLAQLIADNDDSESANTENRKHAEQIVDEIDRTIGQINSFLMLSKPKTAEIRPVCLNNLFASLSPLVSSEAQQQKLTLEFKDNGIKIAADATLLRRTILNLILNAFKACEAGDRIVVEALRDGKQVSLTVTDSGCGIAPEDLAQVTEPYFTRFEGGSGIGLFLVQQITRSHGWELVITSELGEGTRVALNNIVEVVKDAG